MDDFEQSLNDVEFLRDKEEICNSLIYPKEERISVNSEDIRRDVCQV